MDNNEEIIDENIDEKLESNKEEDEKNKKSGGNNVTLIIIRAILCSLIVFFAFKAIVVYNSEGKIVEMASKPIIYIYPEKEQEVRVTLSDKDLLTCSYPKYESGWDVIANQNGDLVDLDTGKKLYSLYYESENKENYKIEKDGFCIKKEDIVPFLEEKLEILGLNYKEKEEFIVYWLPQLEKHNYIYIRFADKEEIANNMELEITPKPDTLIRVMMTWKGLEMPVDVNEQKLTEVNRTGYTIVEWGGTEIND